MSCEQIYIGDYDSYISKMEEFQSSDKSVIFLFCGSTEELTGDSWCPDCRNGISNINLPFKCFSI